MGKNYLVITNELLICIQTKTVLLAYVCKKVYIISPFIGSMYISSIVCTGFT